MLDAAQLLCRVITGDPCGLLRVLGVGGRLAAAVEFGQQFGGLAVLSSSRRFQNSSAVSGMSRPCAVIIDS